MSGFHNLTSVIFFSQVERPDWHTMIFRKLDLGNNFCIRHFIVLNIEPGVGSNFFIE
jgi:hypothetical protein